MIMIGWFGRWFQPWFGRSVLAEVPPEPPVVIFEDYVIEISLESEYRLEVSLDPVHNLPINLTADNVYEASMAAEWEIFVPDMQSFVTEEENTEDCEFSTSLAEDYDLPVTLLADYVLEESLIEDYTIECPLLVPGD